MAQVIPHPKAGPVCGTVLGAPARPLPPQLSRTVLHMIAELMIQTTVMVLVKKAAMGAYHKEAPNDRLYIGLGKFFP